MENNETDLRVADNYVQEDSTENRTGKLSLPIAIVVAGALIAGAIFVTKMPAAPQVVVNNDNQADSALEALTPVTKEDHILGAAYNTQVYVVEFSDTECPFCQRFHSTMHKVVDEYNGKVAWVYRHFPLSFHDKARREAEATECAAALGGNDAFWKYTDRIFEISPMNNGLNPDELYNIADYVGLNASAFRTCLDSGSKSAEVEADIENATEVGVSGTPMSVIVYKDQKIILEGAQPYEAIKAKIDALLK